MGLRQGTGTSTAPKHISHLDICCYYIFCPAPQLKLALAVVQHLDGSYRPPAMCGEPGNLVGPGWGDGLKQL